MRLVIFTSPAVGDNNREVGYILPDESLMCCECSSLFEKGDYRIEKELDNVDDYGCNVAVAAMAASQPYLRYVNFYKSLCGVAVVQVKPGDVVEVSGDSSEFGLEDYNVRVNTTAVVEDVFADGEILATLDEIDGDHLVMAYLPLSKVRCLK